MGSEWNSALVGDALDLVNGYAFKSKEFIDEGTPVIKIKNIKAGYFSEHDFSYVDPSYVQLKPEKVARPGDLLISMSGNRHDGSPDTWVGKVAYFSRKSPYLINQRVGALRVKDSSKFDPKYLAYLLSSWDYQSLFISIATSSGGQANLSPKQILQAPIDYPDIESQKEIASVLSSLDTKIELNRQINNTLESMAQALFKSWFVDFDPVIDNALAAGNPIPDELSARAERRRQLRESPDKLAGQPVCTPDEGARRASTMDGASDNPCPPLPADIQQLFPSSFVFTEEMGWVPKGWVVSTAGDEFIVRGGSTPSTKKPEFWDNGTIHWTTPKDLSGNQTKLLIDTERKITSEGLNTITSGLLPVNTVLMSSRAPVGYLAINKVPVAINQGYIALTCEKTCSPEYAIQWLDSIVDQLKNISGGTTFAEISKKTFRGVSLVVPSHELVDKYTKIVEGNYDKIFVNEKETNSLINIRDSLLPKLLSGEVVVGESCE